MALARMRSRKASSWSWSKISVFHKSRLIARITSSSPSSLTSSVYGKESELSPPASHHLNYREQRGGSHDADIGKRLQAAMPKLLQAPEVNDQARAWLRGKQAGIPPLEP